MALGIGLEFAQLLTDARTFSIADMLADGLGVLLGWIVAPPRTFNVLTALESAWPKSTGGS
jgi:glycopeptide antibiotics resistance protein